MAREQPLTPGIQPVPGSTTHVWNQKQFCSWLSPSVLATSLLVTSVWHALPPAGSQPMALCSNTDLLSPKLLLLVVTESCHQPRKHHAESSWAL